LTTNAIESMATTDGPPRHGDGALHLALDHRGSRRPPVGRAERPRGSVFHFVLPADTALAAGK
jgi:hypothetical protein